MGNPLRMEDDPSGADTVTALRFDGPEIAADLAVWCGGEVARPVGDPDALAILVPGPHGPQPAGLGDWIVLQVDGSYRAYSPEVFAARFEPST